jgi:putative RNA 2'-phosphotransferase
MKPHEIKRYSKFLSLVLRHRPQILGLTLDHAGWVDVGELLAASEHKGKSLTREILLDVVENNDKKRFEIVDGRIRARQGHSLPVSLELDPVTPPETLFHGTATRYLSAIQRDGLKKRRRHHVHLSPDVETARRVGMRHGKPVILQIDAATMYQDGHIFYLSGNGVWLTERVPWRYIEIVTDETS